MDEEMDCDEPSTSEGRTKKVIEIEEKALQKWIGDSREKEQIENLAKSLVKTWNSRFVCGPNRIMILIAEVLKIMSIHGFPHRLDIRKSFGYRSDFNFKYFPSGDVYSFFRDMADLEERLCRQIHRILAFRAFKSTLTVRDLPLKTQTSLEVQLSSATESLNYIAVANLLGNFMTLRHLTHYSNSRELMQSRKAFSRSKLHFMLPFYCFMAIQVIISTNTIPMFNRGQYLLIIVQNVRNRIYSRSTGSVVNIVTEVLATCTAFGLMSEAQKILELSTSFSQDQSLEMGLEVFKTYSMLYSYEKWRRNGGSEVEMTRLADDLAVLSENFDEPVLCLLQAALYVLAATKDGTDEMLTIARTFVTEYPIHLNSIVSIFREKDLDEEANFLINEALQSSKEDVHESSSIWLDWCHQRINHPHRFGIVEEVLKQCCDRLFRYLDYGNNATDQVAWQLLASLMDKLDIALIAEKWPERRSWWPAFHSKPLAPPTDQHRSHIFRTLKRVKL